jgi:hypothetical protein
MNPAPHSPADPPRQGAAGDVTPVRARSGLVLTVSAALTLAVLAAVFLAWQNPHLAVDLANAVWSCF